MSATAESTAHCLAFAQAASDYCHDQARRADEVGAEDHMEAWENAAGAADALVEELTNLRDDGVEER